MGKKKTARGALLAANLPQLQNLIKRDPAAYKEEFLQQLHHFESIRRIFELKPDDEDDAKRFRELVGFLSQVAPCYPTEAPDFPQQLSTLLNQNYASLSQDIRVTLVHNLVLLRNKQAISSLELLQTLFPILPRTTSPTLRSFIRKTILTDIRVANSKSKSHKLNRAIQALLFSMVERGMDAEVQGDKGTIRGQKASELGRSGTGDEAMWAVAVTKELWKKGVWDDAKTVGIVALACFHPNVKVQSAAIHFFLGDEDEDDEEDSEDEDSARKDIRGLQHKHTVKKTTTSSEKKLANKVKSIKKHSAKRQKSKAVTNFPALQLLNDPQTFGEKLYEALNRYDKRFSLDHKILYMQLLSRVMGAHKLCILGFYSYILRFLTYHQLRVTLILVSLAQSVHDLTPPDVLSPIIHKLATEFVHPGVGSEVISAGINAIREVCRRQPWCMDEELLGDLVEYRKSADKGVVTAARSILQLYREVNPDLLKRRERGKAASMGQTTTLAPFGHSENLPQTIDGLDLLKNFLAEQQAGEDGPMDEEDEWKGWDVESDSSDDDDSDASGSWIAVESDDEGGIEVSDSEDEKDGKEGSTSKVKTDAEPTAEDVEMAAAEAEATMELATTKILTPADFALLNDLRLEAAKKAAESTGGTAAKRKLAVLEANKKATENGDSTFLSEMDILGPRKKAKADYASRMESIQKGREGREKFGSSKGKQKSGVVSSSTNREKARQKPVMMVLASRAVKGKKKASLRDKQKRLRAHIDKAKKAGH